MTDNSKIGDNSNKISCQKYLFQQNKYNSSPILELSVKFPSQICHKNINKSLDGTYLADFGINISPNQLQNQHHASKSKQHSTILCCYVAELLAANSLIFLLSNYCPLLMTMRSHQIIYWGWGSPV